MTEAHGDALAMVQQAQSFLRDLERLGLAEAAPVSDITTHRETPGPTHAKTFEVLRSLAQHFGYRVA